MNQAVLLILCFSTIFKIDKNSSGWSLCQPGDGERLESVFCLCKRQKRLCAQVETIKLRCSEVLN